jgi:hypothetical protein
VLLSRRRRSLTLPVERYQAAASRRIQQRSEPRFPSVTSISDGSSSALQCADRRCLTAAPTKGYYGPSFTPSVVSEPGGLRSK